VLGRGTEGGGRGDSCAGNQLQFASTAQFHYDVMNATLENASLCSSLGNPVERVCAFEFSIRDAVRAASNFR